jgi:hypothetical protein
MGGLKGNVAWWAFAEQSAKGTAASAAVSKIPFTGGGITVTRETANLSETDASRDQGTSYVVRTGVEGSTESYVRDSYVHSLFKGALGSRALSVVPSFTVSSATAAAANNNAVTAVSASLFTYTYTATGHTFVAGDTVVIAGASVAAYNGTFTITSVASNQFTVTGTVSGPGAATWTSGTATSTKSTYTYTTSAAHGYAVGDSVAISGASVAAYNGIFIITAVTSTTFAVVGAANPGAVTFTSGSVSKNGTHKITPANALPYYTFWRNQSDVLYEQFQDCLISELTIKGEAGAPLSVNAMIMGLVPSRSSSESAATSSITKVNNDPVYSYNEAQVAIGGTVGSDGLITSPTITTSVRSIELQINNNAKIQQTDDVTPYDVIPGQREITISFDLILEDIKEYNKFFYGTETGTAVSSSIYTTPMQFKFTKGSNSITLDMPVVAYEAFPVEPNAGGDPIIVSVRAQAQRTGDSAKPIVTATVVNNTLAV